MKLLRELLYKTGMLETVGPLHLAIQSICQDSRLAGRNSLFIAVNGTQTNGHDYINKAIEKGSIGVVCEKLPPDLNPTVTYIQVKNSAQALGQISSNFYGNPSEHLQIVGVTGTNGKTTIASLLYKLFRLLGYSCGLISTVKNCINDKSTESTHTTPDAIQLNALLAEMLAAKCTHVFMEVSSHALHQQRVAGVRFKGAVFTNITHDHLDYHLTFENYLQAKQSFFNLLGSEAFALINIDDEHGAYMAAHTKAKVHTYAQFSAADYQVRVLEKQAEGMLIELNDQQVWTPLIGHFNAYNLAAVYGGAMLLGEDSMHVLTKLSLLHAVDGRFQTVSGENGITGIVDYAHTPDALKNVLSTLQELNQGFHVITVVGCGGNRDKAKRPEMARIAVEMSNKVIFTSDNPRGEDPQEIIKEMLGGLNATQKRKVLSLVDRREAIRTACAIALQGDFVLVAGKGHEKYQEIAGVKHPFDDAEELRNALQTSKSH